MNFANYYNYVRTSTEPKLSPASKTAKRYRAREAHEAFFRPSAASPSKRNRRCKHTKQKCHKTRMLTDKERREAARVHWDLNHGMPTIMGHTAQQQINSNLTMTSINFQSLIDYFDNETMHHENLQNLSDLLDD